MSFGGFLHCHIRNNCGKFSQSLDRRYCLWYAEKQNSKQRGEHDGIRKTLHRLWLHTNGYRETLCGAVSENEAVKAGRPGRSEPARQSQSPFAGGGKRRRRWSSDLDAYEVCRGRSLAIEEAPQSSRIFSLFLQTGRFGPALSTHRAADNVLPAAL